MHKHNKALTLKALVTGSIVLGFLTGRGCTNCIAIDRAIQEVPGVQHRPKQLLQLRACLHLQACCLHHLQLALHLQSIHTSQPFAHRCLETAAACKQQRIHYWALPRMARLADQQNWFLLHCKTCMDRKDMLSKSCSTAYHHNGGLKVVHENEAADALGQVGDAHNLRAVLPSCVQLLHITDAQVVVVLALQPNKQPTSHGLVCLCHMNCTMHYQCTVPYGLYHALCTMHYQCIVPRHMFYGAPHLALCSCNCTHSMCSNPACSHEGVNESLQRWCAVQQPGHLCIDWPQHTCHMHAASAELDRVTACCCNWQCKGCAQHHVHGPDAANMLSWRKSQNSAQMICWRHTLLSLFWLAKMCETPPDVFCDAHIVLSSAFVMLTGHVHVVEQAVGSYRQEQFHHLALLICGHRLGQRFQVLHIKAFCIQGHQCCLQHWRSWVLLLLLIAFQESFCNNESAAA